MYKRNRDLIAGILCMIMVFLFTGLVYGADPDIRTPIAGIRFEDVSTLHNFYATTTIYNDGAAELTINSITRLPGGSTEFTAGPPFPFDIPAGGSQAITVGFLPTSEGYKTAVFNVNSNDPDEPNVMFNVSGTVCNKTVCVNRPGSTNSVQDLVPSGETFMVDLTLNQTLVAPTASYKLFYSCVGKDFQAAVTGPCNPGELCKEVIGDSIGDDDGKCETDEACIKQIFTLITTRYCNPYGGCPEKYPWGLPYIAKVRNCALKAEIYDQSGNALASGIGQVFKILPYKGIPTMYIRPSVQTVAPGGSAVYQVNYGKPPYTVDTSKPGITTINGGAPPQVLSGPNPVTITVGNTLSAPCTDTQVVVEVVDSLGKSVSTIYNIDCP